MKLRRVVSLGLLAVLATLGASSKPVGSASVRDAAWVSTGASVTLPGMNVTPVNLARRHVGAAVSVGSLPAALAYTTGGRGLLVVTQGDDHLHLVDTASHQAVRVAEVGVEPDAVAVAPGGRGGKGIALVANLASNTVTPVDLGSWRAGAAVPVGKQPVAIAVLVGASGAATAFVADFGSNEVTPINVTTMQAGPPIAVGPGPQTIAVGAGEVLVGNFGNRTLTPINASTLRAGAAVPLPLNPTDIAVTATGATAYVCGGAAIVSVTTPGFAVGAPIVLPDVAQGIALSADGATAWVTQQAGSLIPVALATAKVGGPIRLGGHPSAIVIGAG